MSPTLSDQTSQSGYSRKEGTIAGPHTMPFGTELLPNTTRFRLFAPLQDKINLLLMDGSRHLMARREEGWHEFDLPGSRAGTTYKFELTTGVQVPDPASRFQPDDCHGPSEVIDPTGFAWCNAGWPGRPWREAVIYEIHVGAFTEAGTFAALTARLPYLAALGVTCIQLMPIGDFPGRRNWGYDGVLLYAPDSSYGRPEDLKRLVDAAHGLGLSVFLDVVYNHFGPDGNYLPLYAQVSNPRHHTPWGAALNFEGESGAWMREFVIHNALYWLEEYRFDGLRLDAVHQIKDDSAEHLLDELARRVRAFEKESGRSIHLVLENEENDVRLLERRPDRSPPLFSAQWNDDLHHCLHVVATGERAGYYREYAENPAQLGRALAEGFVFQGEVMEFRGTPRGAASSHLPPEAFVSFLQNHDQVGNRAFGDRISALAAPEAVRAAAAIYLLAPQVPMLFMGEEWDAQQPFLFFVDFPGELANAVRNGRRTEFARFPEFAGPEARDGIPDPVALDTFLQSKLDWGDADREPQRAKLSWYRRILSTRRAEIVPRIPTLVDSRYKVGSEGLLLVQWTCSTGEALVLQANLSPRALSRTPVADRSLWREGRASSEELGAWSVELALRTPQLP